MTHYRCAGFTLFEALLTMAVSAILFGIALPALSSLLSSNHLTVHVNELSGTLNQSRSHAIRSNRPVVICKSSDTQYCDKGAEWSDGWIAFEDHNHNDKREDGETLVSVGQGLQGKTILRYEGFPTPNYVVYLPSGRTSHHNGTFTFCSARHQEMRRALILYKTGRVRVSDTQDDGAPLKCTA